MRPFAILLLELVGPDFVADIVYDAGDILVLFTQQTVLPDASHVFYLVIKLARLGISQFHFADKLGESLFLATQSNTLG